MILVVMDLCYCFGSGCYYNTGSWEISETVLETGEVKSARWQLLLGTASSQSNLHAHIVACVATDCLQTQLCCWKVTVSIFTRAHQVPTFPWAAYCTRACCTWEMVNRLHLYIVLYALQKSFPCLPWCDISVFYTQTKRCLFSVEMYIVFSLSL